MQRAMVLTAGRVIGRGALPGLWAVDAHHGSRQAASGANENNQGSPPPAAEEDFTRPLADRVEAVVKHEEKRVIQAALEKMGGRRQETADLLGISRKSLHNKMAKYALFGDKNDDSAQEA